MHNVENVSHDMILLHISYSLGVKVINMHYTSQAMLTNPSLHTAETNLTSKSTQLINWITRIEHFFLEIKNILDRFIIN